MILGGRLKMQERRQHHHAANRMALDGKLFGHADELSDVKHHLARQLPGVYSHASKEALRPPIIGLRLSWFECPVSFRIGTSTHKRPASGAPIPSYRSA